MPTENTHIYFADRLCRTKGNCHPAVKRHLKSFYLGSVCPDAFYWTKRESVKNVFLFIHRSSGQPLKDLIFDWLDVLKEKPDEKELVFLFGFLVHCALDVTFHPAINAIAGDVFDENPEKRRAAGYLHAYVECHIDKKINRGSYFKGLKLDEIRTLAGIEFLAGRFGVPKDAIYKAYRTQKTVNLMYKSRAAYYLVCLLQKFSPDSMIAPAYFDEVLRKERHSVADIIKYKDPATATPVAKSFDALLADTDRLAAEWLACADAYYHDRVSREEGAKIIDGRNLVTGRI